MKVKDLVALLQNADQDADVFLHAPFSVECYPVRSSYAASLRHGDTSPDTLVLSCFVCDENGVGVIKVDWNGKVMA